MAKSKKIHVGWAMMTLNKAGNWQRLWIQPKRNDLIWRTFDYEKRCRAGTLKVVKMYVEM